MLHTVHYIYMYLYIELTPINLFQLVAQFQECSTQASPNAFMSLYKEIAKQTDSPTCRYAPQHNKYTHKHKCTPININGIN